MTVIPAAVEAVSAACADWGMTVEHRDGPDRFCVLLVRGRTLPVLALCDTVALMRG